MRQLPDTSYWNKFNGRYIGLLDWHAVDRVWDKLSATTEQWFAFDLNGAVPASPLSASEFSAFLSSTISFLKERQLRPSGGFVYADDLENPTFVKIFDPGKMGASCGGSAGRVYPRWTLSLIAPDVPVPSEEKAAPKGLFSKFSDTLQS